MQVKIGFADYSESHGGAPDEDLEVVGTGPGPDVLHLKLETFAQHMRNGDFGNEVTATFERDQQGGVVYYLVMEGVSDETLFQGILRNKQGGQGDSGA